MATNESEPQVIDLMQALKDSLAREAAPSAASTSEREPLGTGICSGCVNCGHLDPDSGEITHCHKCCDAWVAPF
jgi:hypothetical protein